MLRRFAYIAAASFALGLLAAVVLAISANVAASEPPATVPSIAIVSKIQSKIDWYKDVFAPGFGVFLGVVAGTAVTLACQWAAHRVGEGGKVRNLKFELKMNVEKLNRWLGELTHYRNAVNGNALQNYFGYFDFSRYISVTANDMFVTGLLYKYLTEQEIEALQVITSELSFQGEKFLSDQIQANKANFVQADVVGQINFWENKLTQHRATLQAILQRLG